MKKLILILSFIVFAWTQSNAQGDGFILGGSFSTFSSDGNPSTTTITPIIGGMVSEKVAVGVAFSSTKQSYAGESQSQTSILPFVRIHQKLNDRIYSYVEPYLGTVLVEGSDAKTISLGASFGFLFSITEVTHLDLHVAGLNYTSVSVEGFGSRSATQLDYLSSFANLGLKFYF